MSRAIQPLRRTILTQSQSLLQYLKIHPQTQNPISQFHSKIHPLHHSQPKYFSSSGASVVSEMRKSAIENNVLRLLRNEIDYEADRCPLPQPPAEFSGFKVEERPGEQWISLQKKFGENEEIKVEVTMFDGSIPVPKEGEKKGLPGEEVQLHITMIVSIFKGDSNKVLEFICSAWPDTLCVQKLFVRERAKMPNQPYTGPPFKELDDALQDSVYDFLEERGIDDTLCVLLHKYISYKDQAEYVRWMGSVKSAIEKK